MPRSPSDAPEPILRQKLSDQVFQRLWDMVVSGELAPGDAVPSERALMARFGVGRPAVREALQALAGKGIITISHGERSRVNAPSAAIALEQVDDIAKLLLSTEPANLAHLKQLRKLLETGSATLAAARCGPADVAALQGLIAEQRAALGKPEAFIEGDIAFHVYIATLTGNPLLAVVTRAMLNWLRDYYTPMLHWSGQEETTLAEHAALVDRLGAGSADAASSAMAAHLDRSGALFAPRSGDPASGGAKG